MDKTLKSILKSLEDSVLIAIQKYKSKKDIKYIDIAIDQLTLILELMEEHNDKGISEFKNSVNGMLAALIDTKNENKEQFLSFSIKEDSKIKLQILKRQ